MNEKEVEDLRRHIGFIENGLANHRIYIMNELASKETSDFSILKKFAKEHPIIFHSVMREFKKRPDIRFGDTLLIFCSCVKSGEIKL